jgi:hypothetical protein
MIVPLIVASDGYLKSVTKHVLVIAVAGYLNFGGSPVIPGSAIPQPPKRTGGGHYDYEEEQRKELHARIMREDDEVTETIKNFLQWL